MLQGVCNHTSILKRFSFQTLTLRSFQTLLSPTTPHPHSLHAPRLHSSLTANGARELQTSRLKYLQAKCFSTSSVVVDTSEWKKMDVVADFTDYQYSSKGSLPVRAFYLGKKVDMVRLEKKYKCNSVGLPCKSGRLPDVVFRFGKTNPKTIGFDAISRSNIRYMVVYDYGSVILLNFRDSEINEYLEIVKEHALDSNVQAWFAPPCFNDVLPENAPLKLNITRCDTVTYGVTYGWDIFLDNTSLSSFE